MQQSHLICVVVTTCYLVLHLLNIGSVVVVGESAAPSRNNNTNNNDEHTCTVMQDGSCIVDNKSDIVAVQLPDFDEDGYIDLEYSEKKQQIISGDSIQNENTKRKLIEMHQYMYNQVYVNGAWTLRKDCLNRHELCTYWASIGECTANPAYMTIQCAPACSSCDQLLFETRCPIPDNMDVNNTWKPNDLNLMFENILTNPYYKEQYGTIDVLSKPGMKPNNPNKIIELTDSPWVITIDDFVTPDECDVFIKLGTDRGYEISKDVGARKFDGTYDAITSSGRTSTNTWCQDECYNNTLTTKVFQKIVNLTGIPEENAEYLQLLRYEVGQFYQQHHDYIEHHEERQQGVRILTIFIYLNDVEEGGGTKFPLLDITVMPKRGRVLIWPSVLNENPSKKDYRTDHEALPVIRGTKYAANAWLHLRDFKTPFNASCI